MPPRQHPLFLGLVAAFSGLCLFWFVRTLEIGVENLEVVFVDNVESVDNFVDKFARGLRMCV